jgi:hypothetical protein
MVDRHDFAAPCPVSVLHVFPSLPERKPSKLGPMKKLTPILLGILFALLHAWALAMLWLYGPVNRQLILVLVYAGLLVGSGFLTKRFPPPIAPSLLLFAVVLIWRIVTEPTHWWS